jgi:hypothetical protein
MDLRFWNDPETGLPHIYDHGVTEDEVRQVLSRPGQEFPGRDRSRIRLSQTIVGRYLQVVYLPATEEATLFVVTALEISGNAKKAFRRRQRRKKQ